MGFLGKLLGKKKDNAPNAGKAPAGKGTAGEGAAGVDATGGGVPISAEDFQYSQSIYKRNLHGVYIYEIHAIPPPGTVLRHDMVLGEFIEMTEGLMTLGVLTKCDGKALFAPENELSITYSKHGESFFTEAKIVEAYVAEEGKEQDSGPGDGDTLVLGGDYDPPGGKATKYILQAVLCAEPVRHRREHGRLVIEWAVFFRPDGGGHGSPQEFDEFSRNSVARTIDISEGGFKGRVDEHFDPGTIIKCVVETESGVMSDGELIGKVIRCYHVAGNAYMHEMTVQFIAMDDGVREFLGSWIEKMHPASVNAEARMTVSGEGEQATIELLPPRNNGADLSYDELVAELAGEGITYGIDHDLLRRLSAKPYYNLEYVVARCTPPEHGADAVLTYHVDMHPVFVPKVSEDGSADFRDLGLIHKVSKDEVLVEKVHATAGVPGKSVSGITLDAIPGKDAKFPAGKNTAENEDGTALLAGVDGFISIAGNKINVLDTYVVEGDVQYTTGNIDHNGIVIVKGDVRIGFTVAAEGDVVVHGSVESATVKAGGSVVVHGGCVGELSNIEAGENVAIKFIDGGTVSSGGDLSTSCILGSTVRCGGSVEMVDIGLIRNSHVAARVAINAKTIGGLRTAANNTIAEAGNDPALISRFKSVSADLEKYTKDLESARTSIRTLTMMKYKKQLTGDKAALMDSLKLLAEQHAARRDELLEQHEDIRLKIDELGFGDVNVSEVAYEGLKVIIGPCELVLKDAVRSARLFRAGGEIQIEPIEKKREKAQGSLRSVDI